jgi:type II secretory pathway pseudopilin PulG
MKIKSQKKQQGYTLVELILYISILAILLFAIFLFISLVFELKAKEESIIEVERQGEYNTRLISQTIRNATGINSPTIGTVGYSLSLSFTDSLKNPTIFSVTNGVLYITEGAGNPIALTNNQVTVSTTFANFSRIDTPGNIRIILQLDHQNPENKNEFEYIKTFYGSASLRQ